MEIKLVGIAVVGIGFALRWHPLLVVTLAAFATGLSAGFSPVDVLGLIGTYFTENRFMTLPVLLILPVVGILEKHGLQERAGWMIQRAAQASAGRVLWVYQLLREITSMLGLNLGNHASMVRPLVAPMAEGAARVMVGELNPAQQAKVRAHAAASENWGNFFADDIIVAVGPVLLMKGVFESAGVSVSITALGWWGLPTALMALVLGAWRYRLLDRGLRKERA